MRSTTNRGVRSRPGIGRAGGVVFGIVALAAGAFAVWTLVRVANAPTTDPTEPGAPEAGMAPTASIEAILGSVQQLVRAEQFGAAERVLSDAVRQYPEDQDLRLAYGDLLMSQERWGDSYAQFLGAIEIGPVPAATEFTAGTLASMNDRPRLAAAHYASAMRLNPNNPEYPLYMASVQLELEQVSEAKASLAIAGRLAPDRAEVWGLLAQIALRENKLQIATQHIERARAIQPRVSAWVLMEARIRKRAGEPERALDLIAALPQAVMDEAGTMTLMAECFGMLGRPADAASRYIDAAERDPGNAGFAFEAALWLERAGEREDAIAWAETARERGSDRADAWIRALAQAPEGDDP